MSRMIVQDPEVSKTALFHRINELLKDSRLRRFRAVVSYVRWNGFASIADSLEDLLKRGGTVETVFGVDNDITTPEPLYYSLHLQQMYSNYSFAGLFNSPYFNSEFHPKLFQFSGRDFTTLIVGSANLTGGGLLRNHEICLETEFPPESPNQNALEAIWSRYETASLPASAKAIRKFANNNGLGSESESKGAGNRNDTQKKKQLRTQFPPSNADTFLKKILRRRVSPRKKHEFLASTDSLSAKPRRLYLQVLSETGGGDQIQLPVATLASFFGVGIGQKKAVTLVYAGQPKNVHLTHFENHTHRVRLRQLLGVPRPAILVFTRRGPTNFDCKVIQPKKYNSVLSKKCTEQTRGGSRRWGLDG